MRWIAGAFLCVFATSSLADVVVANRTLRPKTLIEPSDLTAKKGELPGAFSSISDVVGLETRVAIYAGRPVRINDVGTPATVERNQLVVLIYRRGGLEISTDGRSLGRGAPGERIRVMNLSSKTTLTGMIRSDGAIEVR